MKPGGTTIFTNADIVTLDPRIPAAQVVTVVGGKIVYTREGCPVFQE